jgi:hypothetical protein
VTNFVKSVAVTIMFGTLLGFLGVFAYLTHDTGQQRQWKANAEKHITIARCPSEAVRKLLSTRGYTEIRRISPAWCLWI